MSTQLTTRISEGGTGVTVKDAPLTNSEVDNNFISLKDNKLEASSNLSDLTNVTAARSNLNAVSTDGSNASGTWSISVSGNAATATALQNSVKINNIDFDGTEDIDVVTGIISSGFGISNFADWDTQTDITIAIDSSEIATIKSDQTISGTKTFSEPITLSKETTETDHAVRADRTISAGDGLTGGGNLTADRTIDVDNTVVRTTRKISTGEGISGGGDLDSDLTLSVDDTVVRTTGTQELSATQIDSLGVGTPASEVSGEIRATDNITAFYSSDRRLKENITEIDSALGKIANISGVNFDWTDEELDRRGGIDDLFVRKKSVGVIAQEIESVLPEAVGTRNDGYKGVRYELIVPLLIQAIKEQQEVIESIIDKIR